MTFDRIVPYNDLPELPSQPEVETNAVLKWAIGVLRSVKRGRDI